MKREVDLCIMLLLGPKTIDDLYPKKGKAFKNKPKQAAVDHSDPIMSENIELNHMQKGKLLCLPLFYFFSYIVKP